MLGESIVHVITQHEDSYRLHISTNEQVLSKSDKLLTKVSIRSLNCLKIQYFVFPPSKLRCDAQVFTSMCFFFKYWCHLLFLDNLNAW